jgi:hypothetical protein
MRHSPAARRAARQLPPAQLRASAASKSLNVRGNGDGDAAQLLHDWLKADLTCALVPPLYRGQFRRALDAMRPGLVHAVVFVDYLTYPRIEGEWRVTSKAYDVESTEARQG